ncbi:aminotransferase class I/II-fold pyridoxal phosphate-dependent enzyme [Marivivens donghaensis]|uniref:Aminotransferase class I/II-fold pyridoxal phosphate-dependent enzyme n=1 Tax=Marivivens donghaensis TaxID=1699413 RepID=A0ABX0VWR7_9RHOB|nr:aminotransferase class I/II-fold pyridoxal phosphate-dependent enzyme [Marivivens donghaensis]NIY72531.1 aminotransferase class I/II-fold pyridoxal phosphate-dependent enzyme [Marivivens donghaensis]
MDEIFKGKFTQQEPIPNEGIAAAIDVMQSGRLHRYNTIDGEIAQAAQLEEEFAAQVGSRYCLAVASGGYALTTAMRASGVKPGDTVLTNAFTLAPVPGAIASIGATPIYVGVTEGLVIDLDDLRAKVSRSKYLLLSHMRGHICDMDELMRICGAAGVTVIEDCAHTMGANWNGTPSGRFGHFGCYSTQTYKHMNSGEGGLLVSDDAEAMARAIMLSGSYMLFDRHRAAPPPETFKRIKYETPNISGRMDNLRAAILRPQLRRLSEQCGKWNARYRVVEAGLKATPGLSLIERPEEEGFVASSFQFLLLDWDARQIKEVVDRCAKRGVEIKWFGGAEPTGFTSRYDSWQYAPYERMPATDRVLSGILDLRLPLTFSLDDCAMIARIIRAEVSAVWQQEAADQ